MSQLGSDKETSAAAATVGASTKSRTLLREQNKNHNHSLPSTAFASQNSCEVFAQKRKHLVFS